MPLEAGTEYVKLPTSCGEDKTCSGIEPEKVEVDCCSGGQVELIKSLRFMDNLVCSNEHHDPPEGGRVCPRRSCLRKRRTKG